MRWGDIMDEMRRCQHWPGSVNHQKQQPVLSQISRKRGMNESLLLT